MRDHYYFSHGFHTILVRHVFSKLTLEHRIAIGLNFTLKVTNTYAFEILLFFFSPIASVCNVVSIKKDFTSPGRGIRALRKKSGLHVYTSAVVFASVYERVRAPERSYFFSR